MDWVLVTGATRGLGLAISKRLVSEGYEVVAVGRSLTPELEAEVAREDSKLIFERFDFVETARIHDFATKLCLRHGAPYALVNNAAVGTDGILATQHEKDIGRLVAVNLLAPIILTKYLSRQMIVERRGRVVNISSVAASTGFSGLSVYGATKAGLVGFTKSLARELGKVGITVNAIAPGYMDTAMTAGLRKEKLATIVRRSPMGRLADANDVAATVAFLLGEHGASITGTTITVDVGSTA